MIVRSVNIKILCIGLLIALTLPIYSYAQPANTACSNRRVGDACTFTSTSGGRGSSTTSTQSGFCDRTNDDPNAANNPLICRSGDGWGDCAVVGDACLGTTSTVGQRGTTSTTGTCSMQTGSSSPRSSGTTTMVCDTSVKPPGTPGGRAPDGSSGGPANSGAPDGSSGGPANGSGGGGAGGSSPQTVGFTNPIRFNSIPELIAGIINALLGILGAVTVAILVMSGFKYMTSSNPGEVGQALDGIRNAIVGLMIIMGSFLITQYVISALAG